MKKPIIWISALLLILTLLIWHVINWHATGMHTRLLELAKEGKPYLSILYNLGLIAVTASTLGLLMGKITNLISSKSRTTDVVDESEKAGLEK